MEYYQAGLMALAPLLIHVQTDDTAANSGAFSFVSGTEPHALP